MKITLQFAESRWLALFIFGYDSFEPHKEIVDCFYKCSSQSMFHQDSSWWTSGLNHIDDSFLHCLVFKEHRRIAPATHRLLRIGFVIVSHGVFLVKQFFQRSFARTISQPKALAPVWLPACRLAATCTMIQDSLLLVNTFLTFFSKNLLCWKWCPGRDSNPRPFDS